MRVQLSTYPSKYGHSQVTTLSSKRSGVAYCGYSRNSVVDVTRYVHNPVHEKTDG
jgi:hypothetical protein